VSVLPAGSAPSANPRETFNRFEVKYFLPTRQVAELVSEFADYTRPDPHSLEEWGYPIHSVYWDTSDFQFFWEKVEGVKFRRKLRFRRYGTGSEVFVEIKQREDRTVQKRRFQWPFERVDDVFGDGSRDPEWSGVEGEAAATEAALLIQRLRLRPRMAISYRRRAMFGAFDPELRISLDGRIQYHPTDFSLAQPFETGRYVLDPRVTVLEIKYDHRAPTWLTKAVCRHGLKMIRMSKYCSAVDQYCFGGQNT
jgi:SPX domain protein involved in polyphosphate accumulation